MTAMASMLWIVWFAVRCLVSFLSSPEYTHNSLHPCILSYSNTHDEWIDRFPLKNCHIFVIEGHAFAIKGCDCWNSRGNIEHTTWQVPMRASEQYIILQLLIMWVPFSLFSEPRIYSIILYICSILTSKSPRAFARVPVPTRVNEGDTFISTVMMLIAFISYLNDYISHWGNGMLMGWYLSFISFI